LTLGGKLGKMQTRPANAMRYPLMPADVSIDMNVRIGETIKPTVGGIIVCMAAAGGT
jgi:hypothetical protein